jgi:hypothetical protein
MRFLVVLPGLPWWIAGAALGAAAACAVYWVVSFQRRFQQQFEQICHDAVLEVGKALAGAEVEVHEVKAAPRPAGPSPYDVQEGDEEFCEDIDGKPWDEDGCHFYSIDATITPADPTAKWDPTALAVVPADYEPEDPIDVSGDLGGMHSAERFVNGRWVPLKEGDRRGPQRVRMLFAVNEGITAVKFANFTHYFGHVALPAPLPKAGSRF